MATVSVEAVLQFSVAGRPASLAAVITSTTIVLFENETFDQQQNCTLSKQDASIIICLQPKNSFWICFGTFKHIQPFRRYGRFEGVNGCSSLISVYLAFELVLLFLDLLYYQGTAVADSVKIEPVQTRNEAEMSQRNCLFFVNDLKTNCAPTEIFSGGAALRSPLKRPADYGVISGGKPTRWQQTHHHIPVYTYSNMCWKYLQMWKPAQKNGNYYTDLSCTTGNAPSRFENQDDWPDDGHFYQLLLSEQNMVIFNQ